MKTVQDFSVKTKSSSITLSNNSPPVILQKDEFEYKLSFMIEESTNAPLNSQF